MYETFPEPLKQEVYDDRAKLADARELESIEKSINDWRGSHPQTGQIKRLSSGREYRVRRDGAWVRISND